MESARLRVVHALEDQGGELDIVAVIAGGDVSNEMDRSFVWSGVSQGAASDYHNLSAGLHDMYIFRAGEPYVFEDAVARQEDVMLRAASKGSLFMHGATRDSATPSSLFIAHQAFVHEPSSGGHCVSLDGEVEARGSETTGVCLQRCDGYEDFGSGLCEGSGTSDCVVLQDDVAICAEVGTLSAGDRCQDETSCGEGTFCDRASDGSGVCRSYCTVEGFEQNPHLIGCQGEEQCFPTGSLQGLGECHIACTPEAPGVFRDTSSCPSNMQTCYPHHGHTYCSASGETAPHEECARGEADPTSDLTCAAGALCARDIAVAEDVLEVLRHSFKDKKGGEIASCHPLCRPFLPPGSASDCDEGYACTAVLPVEELDARAGICTKITPTMVVEGEERCEEMGRMCGDASFCVAYDLLPAGDGVSCDAKRECVSMCDPATGFGCKPEQGCELMSSNPASSFQLPFGVCRDRK